MTCLCAATRQAARLLTHEYERELRKAGMTAAQFELLGTLSGAWGLPQSQLARALGLNQTTLSRNLRVLIVRKWIARTSSAQDRRQITYILTPIGEAALRDAKPHWKRAQASLQHAIGSEWDAVLSAVALLNRSLAAD